MTISLVADPSGTSGKIQVGGSDAATFTADGLQAGSYGAGSVVAADLATAVLPLGVGQTWQSVTRVAGTTYTNDTGRPIVLAIIIGTSGASGSLSLSVGGITVAVGGATINVASSSISAIIPAGATYSFTISGSMTGNAFRELR